MAYRKYLQNVLIGATATVVAGANLVPHSDESGPVLRSAISFVSGKATEADSGVRAAAMSPLSS
jgi:hypothetical protein